MKWKRREEPWRRREPYCRWALKRGWTDEEWTRWRIEGGHGFYVSPLEREAARREFPNCDEALAQACEACMLDSSGPLADRLREDLREVAYRYAFHSDHALHQPRRRQENVELLERAAGQAEALGLSLTEIRKKVASPGAFWGGESMRWLAGHLAVASLPEELNPDAPKSLGWDEFQRLQSELQLLETTLQRAAKKETSRPGNPAKVSDAVPTRRQAVEELLDLLEEALTRSLLDRPNAFIELADYKPREDVTVDDMSKARAAQAEKGWRRQWRRARWDFVRAALEMTGEELTDRQLERDAKASHRKTHKPPAFPLVPA